MNLRDTIFSGIKEAMKARDAVRLESLRFVWSRIKEEEIDAKKELNDEEVTALLLKEVKARKEAIEQFRVGGREDLVKEEEEKLVHLTVLLPQQMSEEEIALVVEEVMAAGIVDFGSLMGRVMGRLKGKADGGLVSKVVKEKVSSLK